MCPHEEKLTAWLLGDLPPEEHEAMARHLEACDSCRSAREELSRVLQPLRSGLEKDRAWQPPAAAAPSCAREAWPEEEGPVSVRPSWWSWLWSPNEGLKRVAILALSFGTFFAMVGVVYQSLRPAAPASDGVTYVSFLQEKEAPAPALVSDPEMKSDAVGQALPAAAVSLPAAAEAPAVIANPAPPALVREALVLPKIADAEAARAATRKALADAPARPEPAAAAAPAKAAKRERAKDEAVVRRLPSAPVAKAVQLAGAVAPTNAAQTNATLTNAVSPKARSEP